MLNILYVAVTCDASKTLVFNPSTVTLTDAVDAVVWWLDTPKGKGELRLRFENGKNGPFTELKEDGTLVIASGNVGPDRHGRNEYHYKAEAETAQGEYAGKALVVNAAQEAHSAAPIRCDPRPGEPPTCDGNPILQRPRERKGPHPPGAGGSPSR